MASAGVAYITIAGDWAPFSKEIAALPTSKVGRAMTTAGKKLTRNLTLPLVGIGVAAGKMSMDFNRSMGEISTQAGGSRKEVKKLGDQILKLTAKGRFAQGPQELTKALYDIESVGFRGAKAMKTLKAASDFATVGNADLESTTSALVGTLKTGIKGAGNMKQAIGTLNATIGAGKMHMEDLNAAIGTGFLGSAKGLGISLSGIGAALAELTSQGVPASSAATRLRMTMSLMANPTDKAKTALESIGIGSEDIAKKMRSSGGLVTALELLQTKMQGLSKIQQNQLLTAAFGGAKSGGTIVQLLGNLGDLSKKQGEVIENAGKINQAIKETNAEPAVKMQKAWSKIQSTLITLGDVLVPAVTPVIEELAGDISNVAKDFEKLSPNTQGWIVKIGLAVAALGPLLSIGGRLLTVYGGIANALTLKTIDIAQAGGAGGVVGGAGRAGGAGGVTAVEGAGAGAAGGGVSGALAKFGFKPGLGGFVVPVTLMVGSAVATHEFAQEVGRKTGTSGTGIPSWVEGIAANVAGTASPIVAGFSGLQELTGGALPGPGHVTEKAGKMTWAVGVKPNLSPAAANKLKTQYRGLMHSLETDSILGLKTINHDLAQGLRTASTIWGRNTPEWHKKTAHAMEAAVKSIRQGMKAGTVNAKEGQHEINQILARIRLVKGSDPFGLAQATTKSFKEVGAITSGGVKQWEQKLALMPKGARESSQQSTLQMLRAWAQGHPKIEAQVHQLTSNLITKFEATNKQLREGVKKGATGPVADAFHGLASGVGGSLQNIGVNVQQVLKALGVKNIPQFQIALATGGGSKFDPIGSGPGPGHTHRAMGGPIGFTVPGSGEGDSFATKLPPGSFVLNKKATSAFGFRAGGHIPVMLEPRERVFTPPEVRGIGLRNLSAMNEAVPRFAKGGSLAGEPKLMGGTDTLRSLGQAAIQRVYEGAKSYLAKHRPKGGVGGASFGPKGVGSYKGVPMANWVIQALQYAASKGAAPQPTSGYRSHAQNVSEGRLYFSEHEKTQYPGGAVDFGSYTSGLAAKMSVVNATKGFKYPLLAPIGFRDDGHASGTGHQLGGLMIKSSGVLTPEEWGGAMLLGGFPKIAKVISEGLGTIKSESSFDASQQGQGPSGHIGGWAESPAFGSVAERLNSIKSSAAAFQEWRKDGHSFWQAWGQWEADQSGLAGGGAGAYGPEFLKTAEHVIASGVTGGKDHAIPKQITGLYPKAKAGQTSAGGGTYGSDIKGHFKVRTDRLNSFGSLPDNLQACTKELRERQRELGEYRAASRQTKDPEAKKSLSANITLLQSRISALRQQRTRLLRQKALKKAIGKITEAAEFKAWTEPNIGIFAKREYGYNLAQELADQAVTLEPEEPRGGATMDWVKGILEPYVNNVESPAFARVLGSEAGWRNSILGAEGVAGNRMVAWREQINHLQTRIAEIQGFRQKSPNAWEKFKDLIPGLRQKVGTLRGSITKTRNETLPEWEESLGGVQGLGRTHEERPTLSGVPTGEFGGNIFETQLAVKGLGLKITEAMGNLSGPDDSESKALLEEIARQANQRTAVSEAQKVTLEGWDKMRQGLLAGLPKAHAGATVLGPPSKEVAVMVRGGETILPEEPVVVAGGEAGGEIQVVVNGDIVQEKGDRRDPVEVVLGDRRFVPAVQKAARGGRPTGILTAGGARR